MLHRTVPGSQRWRSMAAIGLTAVIACGCTGQSNLADDIVLLHKSSDGLSPQAAALLQEAQEHAKTRATGAAVGAAGGLLAGVLGSTQTKNSGVKALAIGGGVAAGAAIGYAAGAYVDARNQRAANDQAHLNVLVYAAQQDAARYQADRARAQASVDESQQAVDRLNSMQASSPDATVAYRQQARNLDATATALRSMISESGDNIKLMEQDLDARSSSGEDTSGLQAQRIALQTEHDGLVGEYRRLLTVVDAVPAAERPVITASLP
jgi:hypothetical protein